METSSLHKLIHPEIINSEFILEFSEYEEDEDNEENEDELDDIEEIQSKSDLDEETSEEDQEDDLEVLMDEVTTSIIPRSTYNVGSSKSEAKDTMVPTSRYCANSNFKEPVNFFRAEGADLTLLTGNPTLIGGSIINYSKSRPLLKRSDKKKLFSLFSQRRTKR